MNSNSLKQSGLSVVFGLIATVAAAIAYANGPIGDHVNDMPAHIGEYSEEVYWMIDQVEELIS